MLESLCQDLDVRPSDYRVVVTRDLMNFAAFSRHGKPGSRGVDATRWSLGGQEECDWSLERPRLILMHRFHVPPVHRKDLLKSLDAQSLGYDLGVLCKLHHAPERAPDRLAGGPLEKIVMVPAHCELRREILGEQSDKFCVRQFLLAIAVGKVGINQSKQGHMLASFSELACHFERNRPSQGPAG